MPQIGESAPDFTLQNQDGKNVSLSDYRGKKVILFAFPRAGTLGCNNQACGFRDAFPRFETADAVVLGISDDSVEDLRNWKETKRLPYDLLSDRDHAVLSAWSAWGTDFLVISLPVAKRSYWVIDENGIVIDEQINVSPGASVKKALAAVENTARPANTASR